jgi:uncharacterized peroxidase-related enzyme
MSRITALSIEQAPEGSRPYLDGVQQAFGMVPNVFKVLAHSPAVLSSYLKFYETMETNSFSAKQREIVSLAVSQVNGCEYCLSVHTLFGGKAGLSAEEIRSARDGQLDAYARFAHQVTVTRGQVSDQDLAAARAAGLTDANIVEVIAQVALLTFSNLLNNVAHTPMDFPRVDV